ncbi:MAG: histidinol dehydrogenase [Desulfosarcina sp.]|nr:histidinol dehydrogenase [Desulfosarcina sp.]MBC2743357.1 histidinol dehydrogenase [Desulfosarcina sp.]MBC2766267.1 histidinol dehydrogenase [Desulfosarcina sp.]
MRYFKKPIIEDDASQDSIKSKTAEIINHVMSGGLDAVKELTARFDRYQGPLRVDKSMIDRCRDKLEPHVRDAVETASENIRMFHENQRALLKDSEWETQPGVFTGIRFVPVESVAVYVPGGRYPLVSTVLMGVIPAQVAKVNRIVIVSPPRGNEGVDQSVLGVIGLLGVGEVWSIGGAQAIAAVALGVGDIEKVDMVVGPGNAYVTEAKRLMFGQIGIDGLAGPSEVLIIADTNAPVKNVATDLLAQAEHDPLSISNLFCTSEDFANNVMRSIEDQLINLPTREIAQSAWHNNGSILVGTLDEAVAYANDSAPEHLELMVDNPKELLAQIHSYGSAFLGSHTSVPFGDFITGTNHILPTGRAARFSGGVWTGTFLKALTHQEFTEKAPAQFITHGVAIAQAEGLAAHANSIKARGR